jgi:hypothetical protein
MNPPWWNTAAVPAFVDLAEAWVAFVGNAGRFSSTAFLHEAHVRLPALYSAALALPHKTVDDKADDGDGDEDSPEELGPGRRRLEWHAHELDVTTCRQQKETIERLLGASLARYAEIFDPYADPPAPPVTGSLGDDLVDIAIDLDRGLARWRCGDCDEAVFHWRVLFESHGSEHITGALRAIRSLAAQHDLEFPGHSSDSA